MVFVAHYNIMLMPEHIAGVDNCTRNNMYNFFSINPQASHIPTPVGPLLQQLLQTPGPDWTTPSFRQLFLSIIRGLAPSTPKLYHVGQQRYIHFCSQHSFTALPSAEFTLLSFASYLAKHNIMHSTIKVYISAIRNLHIMSGQHHHFANQLTPRLEQVLRGIKRD